MCCIYLSYTMINILDIDGFEWDKGNESKNVLKHKVTNKEAEEVFENTFSITIKSKYEGEDRLQTFGTSKSGKLLCIIYTIKKSKIRIISARPVSKKERNFYNEKVKEEGN